MSAMASSRITGRDIEISAGTGLMVPIPLARDRTCGEIMRMPGLTEAPAAVGMGLRATALEQLDRRARQPAILAQEP